MPEDDPECNGSRRITFGATDSAIPRSIGRAYHPYRIHVLDVTRDSRFY
jgi:hypothetical protein